MIYRLYFNRCEDWPQIWSIDNGDTSTEINVTAWRVEVPCTVTSDRADDLATVDRARQPVAWASIEAQTLTIERGVAVFS